MQAIRGFFRWLQNYSITNPALFYAVSALIVGYILYMMIRRRKGERVARGGGPAEHEIL